MSDETMSDDTVTDDAPADDVDVAETPQAATETGADESADVGGVDVQPMSLSELASAGDDPGSTEVPMRDIGLLASIDVELSVELGRARLPMRRLLSMSPGSVLDLDRPAGTSVDVLVNGLVIAKGEVVVVDGDFGVRVTEVIRKPSD